MFSCDEFYKILDLESNSNRTFQKEMPICTCRLPHYVFTCNIEQGARKRQVKPLVELVFDLHNFNPNELTDSLQRNYVEYIFNNHKKSMHDTFEVITKIFDPCPKYGCYSPCTKCFTTSTADCRISYVADHNCLCRKCKPHCKERPNYFKMLSKGMGSL